jgi:hypothetical protein
VPACSNDALVEERDIVEMSMSSWYLE